MPWSSMEVSDYGQRYIVYVVLYVRLLYVIWGIDSRSPPYGYSHIKLHTATYSCCFHPYGRLLNVHPGSYFWWLHWERRGGRTGVYIPVLCQSVRYLMKCPWISLIQIRSHLAAVDVYSRFAGVE